MRPPDPRTAPETEVRRVLVYRIGSLGDTVVALPAFHRVARRFPNATRSLLTKKTLNAKAPPVASLLEHSGLVHGEIVYADRPGVGGIFDLIRAIRSFSPDVLVYLPPTRSRWQVLRDRALFFLGGARRVEGVGWAHDQRLPRAQGHRSEYEGDRLLRVLEGLAMDPEDDNSGLHLTSDEQRSADLLLSSWPGRERFAVFSPGAKTDVQHWGTDRWSALFKKIRVPMDDWGLLGMGTADEWQEVQPLLDLWKGPTLNLCGKTPPRVSAAILSRGKLFLGHDSGPLHLANAAGLPCVAVFSGRDRVGEWHPPGPRHRLHYREVPCQGCRRDECPDLEKFCIRDISVEDVAESVLEIAGA
ncbi:MAG: glycosyltransferase family 9 protein [Gammaproteobacteria bacterium]